jgi:hypothetical protein
VTSAPVGAGARVAADLPGEMRMTALSAVRADQDDRAARSQSPMRTHADVSEFRLCILMLRSASPFAISNASEVRAEHWYPPSGWASCRFRTWFSRRNRGAKRAQNISFGRGLAPTVMCISLIGT